MVLSVVGNWAGRLQPGEGFNVTAFKITKSRGKSTRGRQASPPLCFSGSSPLKAHHPDHCPLAGEVAVFPINRSKTNLPLQDEGLHKHTGSALPGPHRAVKLLHHTFAVHLPKPYRHICLQSTQICTLHSSLFSSKEHLEYTFVPFSQI